MQTDGFAIVEDVLSYQKVNDLLHALERIGDTGSVRKRGGIFAVRNLLDVSAEVRKLADSNAVRVLVEPILELISFPSEAFCSTSFQMQTGRFHGLRTYRFAVRERIEVDGFGPWSMKEDVLHVQPPAMILEHMLTVRLHLDPCDEEMKRTALCVFCLDRTRAVRPRRRSRLSARVCRRRSVRSD